VDQRLSFVTLGVRDLTASRAFYVDGLGWQPALEVAGEVLMLKVGPQLVLSLWDRGAFEREVGAVAQEPGLSPVTLSHNVPEASHVDTALATAGAAGASSVSPAEDREWGGRSGYFADPDGFRWEVAWNPGPIGQEVLP
jgi:catechol 2,3-dioxygenase-like lactoylglutathione lyase family enzyme